jgi:DNA-binding beta-propeller fold protein YncE
MNVRCAILSLLARAAVAVAGTGVPLSPEFLAPSHDGRTLYVTARTGRSLLVTRLPAGEVAARIALPDQPTGVAVSRDGKSVAVTVGQKKVSYRLTFSAFSSLFSGRR